MSRNHRETDFSNDYGKTVPINRKFWLSPINHRDKGLTTGVYLIRRICLNEREFFVDSGWHRMADYKFGAVEPEESHSIAGQGG